MSAKFQLEFRQSNGNLFIDAAGDFDGHSAWELMNAINRKYAGQGRVFVNTERIEDVTPFGQGLFHDLMAKSVLPKDRLFLKGEKGFEIGPDGSSVLIGKKKNHRRCDGRCSNCRCGHCDKAGEMAAD